ncbi:DUF2290 domain-containing protein [Ferirhizobium litorale]|uniref:DUF2290 domain-containing protein n=1 Tax=Ferirhizobium litorale TaxID=2927786 RepID=A0AAE3QCJ1_9HYPH|nr:DUF2290 domain-containing protein [Fererhizobium litorale]MDI7920704.1 DUF2290 domain-containing protein [Fererhizobium litorale]
MPLANNILSQISEVTADLISCGLSSDQNFPSMSEEDNCNFLTFAGENDLSITLKNVYYVDLYAELKARRQFNVQLIDGALLQMQYILRGDEVKKHRLAFFPAPDLAEYQNNPDIYETDEIYADILSKNIVTSPIRFDFDRDNFKDEVHPMSHMTIGQYKNCRIAVGGPLTPYVFIHFILKSFYNTALNVHSKNIRAHNYDFDQTITEAERNSIHIMTPPNAKR